MEASVFYLGSLLSLASLTLVAGIGGGMRHIARIIVDFDVLRQALGLPEGAEIRGVSEAGRYLAIEVKVEHSDCPEVEEGYVIPVVEPTFVDGKLVDWGLYAAR